MAPTYENQSPASPFNLELSGDHGDHHQYHHLFNLEEPHDHQTSFSPSSLSSPIFFTPPADHDQPQPPSQYREPQKFQFQLLEADKIASYRGSCDDQTLENEGGDNGSIVKLSISKNGAQRNGGDEMHSSSSVKWMSSKMRIMRKMTNPDQTSSSSTATTTSSDEKPISMSHKMSSSSNNTNTTAPIIRVCSDCNTTKTPLWRSGPRGPKSLCNACGIRQRKARRAMAAAAAAANGTTLAAAMAAGAAPSMKSSSANKVVQHKEHKSRVGSTVPFKKRPYKLTSSSSSSTSPASRGNKSANKKLCTFEDFTITMNTNGSSAGGGGDTTTTTTTTATTSAALHQRVFPQDEKEAAILLMALSCGLVHG